MTCYTTIGILIRSPGTLASASRSDKAIAEQSSIVEDMADLVFEAAQDADASYCADCLTENIFAPGARFQRRDAGVGSEFAFSLSNAAGR
jgi:hypothetical protein